MRIVFMGTPDFAVPCLNVCLKEHEVVAVFTQPDRPKGRGKKLAAPPVKERALEAGIDVYQPEKLKTPENVDVLKGLQPDCIVVVAYGQFLSKEILNIPAHGCVNVHASLLPKFRGASPINWAIVQGETVSGVTTMYMDVGMDTGDMILKDQMDIPSDMTAGELHDALMEMGGRVLSDTLRQIADGTAPRIPQKEEESSYAPLLSRDMAVIDWTQPVDVTLNLIRGMTPWPVANSRMDGKTMKVYRASAGEQEVTAAPGTVLQVDKTGMYVQGGNGVLRLEEIQFAGSRRMHISQYILGHDVQTGIVLG